MTLKNLLFSCLGIAVILIGVALIARNYSQNLAGIGGPQIGFNRFTTASSSYFSLVGGAPMKILGTTTDRAYASIYNSSGKTVYLNINQGSYSSTTYGLVLEANDIYEFIPGKNLYDGTVYASSSGAAVLHILEVTTDD